MRFHVDRMVSIKKEENVFTSNIWTTASAAPIKFNPTKAALVKAKMIPIMAPASGPRLRDIIE